MPLSSFIKARLKNLNKHYSTTLVHSSNPAFYYFTDLPYSSWQPSFAILEKSKITLLSKHPEDSPYPTLEYKNRKELKQTLLKFFSKKKQIPSTLSLSPIKLKTQNISSHLNNQRAIKDIEEIKRLKKSTKTAQSILEAVPNLIEKNKTTEAQLANTLEYLAKDFSYETLAFPPIVASNTRSSFVHSKPSNKKISKGNLMIDFGLRYKNYCSDLTRIYFLSTKENLKTYETLNNIKECSVDLISESQTYKEATKKIQKLYKKTFNKDMPHSFGHGIGILVHDSPSGLSLKSKDTIKPNQSITIEPAYYTSKYGLRIEDDYLINKKGKPIPYSKAKPIFF